jgi:hypothetical protein
MKFKSFSLLILALAVMTIGCAQESNPFSPLPQNGNEISQRTSTEAYTTGRIPKKSSSDVSGRELPASTDKQSLSEPGRSQERNTGGPGPAFTDGFNGINAPGLHRNENHPDAKPNGTINKTRTSHGELAASIVPQRWNVNWSESDEDLKVKIFGEGFDAIDPGSVVLSNGVDPAIPQSGNQLTDSSLVVFFKKVEALTLIDKLIPGAEFEILVMGTATSGPFTLTDSISIVGNKRLGDLAAEIRPGKWNIAWSESLDDVTVKISGEGFSDVVPGSVKMRLSGETVEISSYSDELGGTYFTAFFHQSEAIGLLENPKRGDTYLIDILFDVGSDAKLIAFTISIVGSKKSGEYNVKISPDKWNPAWTDNTEELTLKIFGGDPSEVDTGTIKMTGPNGTVITPTGTEIDDDNLLAKFLKQAAIGLIDNPQAGSEYTVTVEFSAGGDDFIFSPTITISGKKK